MDKTGKARGRPFAPGNPGRPPGSKNKVTEAIEQLADGEGVQIIHQLIERAKAGHPVELRIVADRIWPARRGAPIKLELPPINTGNELIAAIRSLWTAIGQGQLTPDEVMSLAHLTDRSLRILETEDFAKRLKALEDFQAQQNEKKHS
jgi:hypothetical protein